MSVNIRGAEGRALIAAQLGPARFDAAGMTLALKVTNRLLVAGVLVTDCPDRCGGAG